MYFSLFCAVFTNLPAAAGWFVSFYRLNHQESDQKYVQSWSICRFTSFPSSIHSCLLWSLVVMVTVPLLVLLSCAKTCAVESTKVFGDDCAPTWFSLMILQIFSSFIFFLKFTLFPSTVTREQGYSDNSAPSIMACACMRFASYLCILK